jgi:hypothetical protein
MSHILRFKELCKWNTVSYTNANRCNEQALAHIEQVHAGAIGNPCLSSDKGSQPVHTVQGDSIVWMRQARRQPISRMRLWLSELVWKHD